MAGSKKEGPDVGYRKGQEEEGWREGRSTGNWLLATGFNFQFLTHAIEHSIHEVH